MSTWWSVLVTRTEWPVESEWDDDVDDGRPDHARTGVRTDVLAASPEMAAHGLLDDVDLPTGTIVHVLVEPRKEDREAAIKAWGRDPTARFKLVSTRRWRCEPV